jgi:hypothetical protein
LAAQPIDQELLAQKSKNATAAAAAAKQAPAKPVLQQSINSGHYIQLSDNSLWEISPSDTIITASWITPVEITIESSGNKAYPYKLTNTLTGSSVLARRATNLPEKTTPTH